jgi:hypothetical protein
MLQPLSEVSLTLSELTGPGSVISAVTPKSDSAGEASRQSVATSYVACSAGQRRHSGFQTCTILSSPPEARCVLSGDQATARTAPTCSA